MPQERDPCDSNHMVEPFVSKILEQARMVLASEGFMGNLNF